MPPRKFDQTHSLPGVKLGTAIEWECTHDQCKATLPKEAFAVVVSASPCPLSHLTSLALAHAAGLEREDNFQKETCFCIKCTPRDGPTKVQDLAKTIASTGKRLLISDSEQHILEETLCETEDAKD